MKNTKSHVRYQGGLYSPISVFLAYYRSEIAISNKVGLRLKGNILAARFSPLALFV